ncbi:MAG: hypothetical protein JSW00_14215 [Thermoplasmata archaeon]|nr:MAG: hypothetical protein JSW00_14215 [Thermoplasmata archaeon]
MDNLQKAVMLSFIAFILLLSSFILPWYGTHTESEYYDSHNEVGYGMTLSFFLSPSTVGGATFYGGSATSGLLTLTAIFVILALIFIGLFFIFSLFKAMDKSGPTYLLKVIGVLGMIFCILAPIIFMIALPGAMKADVEEEAAADGEEYDEPDHDHPTKSFFGSYEDTDEDDWGRREERASWGGDIGWLLAFVSFVFILIALIISSMEPSAAPPYGMQYPGAPPYQPPAGPTPQKPMPPPPTQPPPHTLGLMQVTCPSCRQPFTADVRSYPAPVKCPYCGMRGFIE